MRRLKNGWEIAGATSICIALASIFIYIMWELGLYGMPSTTDVVVSVVLTAVTLFLFIWSPPDENSNT